jgi:hypothetical protein
MSLEPGTLVDLVEPVTVSLGGHPQTPSGGDRASKLDSDALYLTLAWEPATPEGMTLCEEVLGLVLEQRRQAKAPGSQRTRMGDYRFIVGALCGDLVAALGYHPPRRVYRSLDKNSFVKGGSESLHQGGYDGAVGVFRSMESLGLLIPSGDYYFNPRAPQYNRATLRQVTSSFAALASKHGVDGTRHFNALMPVHPLELRAEKRFRGEEYRDGSRPAAIRVPPAVQSTPAYQTDLAVVKDLNTFLQAQDLRAPDGSPAFRGFRRVYSVPREAARGDLENYAWDRQGRLYATFQMRPKEDRVKDGCPEGGRLSLTIAGEPTAEIDLRASHLTALYGMFGFALPEGDDLYGAVIHPETGEAIHRDLVKEIATMMISNLGNVPKRWPEEKLGKLIRKFPTLLTDYPASTVGQALLAAHSVLGAWKDSKMTGHHLVYRESKVLVETMLRAKDLGFGVFGVHDSLLVPRSRAEEAKEILLAAYEAVFRIRPRVKVEGS